MKRKKGKFAVIFSTRNGNVCQLEKSFLFFPYFSFGGLQDVLDFKKKQIIFDQEQKSRKPEAQRLLQKVNQAKIQIDDSVF